MPTGLLITRPRAEAARLAERLNSLGIHSWVYPTIGITPLTPTAESLSWAAQAELWIFVSANAVHAGWTFLAPLYTATLRLAAVGLATARRLQEASGTPVLCPEQGSDSEALLALPLFQRMDHRKIAIIRGRGGREWLREALEQRGAQVGYIECYVRQVPQSNPETLDEALQAGASISVQSTESLHNLWAMASPAQREILATRPFIVSHPRIATALRALGLPHPVVLSPGDDALIAHYQKKGHSHG